MYQFGKTIQPERFRPGIYEARRFIQDDDRRFSIKRSCHSYALPLAVAQFYVTLEVFPKQRFVFLRSLIAIPLSQPPSEATVNPRFFCVSAPSAPSSRLQRQSRSEDEQIRLGEAARPVPRVLCSRRSRRVCASNTPLKAVDSGPFPRLQSLSFRSYPLRW